MEQLSYSSLTRQILSSLSLPRRTTYYLAVVLSLWGILIGAGCWAYMVYVGLGTTGLNHPVMWGSYLINFVFWIEIGHAGSMMSALLYLCRAPFRNPIARSAEAMTIFSVAIAGLFPFIHLGRSWIFYWLIAYPNQRDLWPNVQSPLIFDFWAAAGYLLLSTAFWYVGLIPDLAVLRDRSKGIMHFLYKVGALGWMNVDRQWRPYKAAYLFLAALTTAFVPCVASIVSWDYALTIIPGYHSTIWGPYFLFGAVHSGLAMLLTLLVPLRRIYSFENLITPKVMETVAKIMIATAILMIYTYFVEHFLGWYSGKEDRTSLMLRMTGPYRWEYWVTVVTALFSPFAFFSRKIRTSPGWLFFLSIVINIGMWLERFVIIVGPPSHDYVPYAWGTYWPSFVEWGILLGSFSLFSFLFLLYSKLLPTVSITEMKESLWTESREGAS